MADCLHTENKNTQHESNHNMTRVPLVSLYAEYFRSTGEHPQSPAIIPCLDMIFDDLFFDLSMTTCGCIESMMGRTECDKGLGFPIMLDGQDGNWRRI